MFVWISRRSIAKEVTDLEIAMALLATRAMTSNYSPCAMMRDVTHICTLRDFDVSRETMTLLARDCSIRSSQPQSVLEENGIQMSKTRLDVEYRQSYETGHRCIVSSRTHHSAELVLDVIRSHLQPSASILLRISPSSS